MNSLPQMPFVIRNFIFFSNTLPTGPQRLNLSRVLDHSPQWPDSRLTLWSIAPKDHDFHKQQGSTRCSWAMRWSCLGSASVSKTWIFTCLHIYIFIYESMPLPYSKNDLKRLISVEKIEQDNRKRT